MEFYVTFFGSAGPATHPWGNVDPDGYVTVVADDIVQARAVAMAWFGQAWSYLYEERPEQHTAGELRKVDVSTHLAGG